MTRRHRAVDDRFRICVGSIRLCRTPGPTTMLYWTLSSQREARDIVALLCRHGLRLRYCCVLALAVSFSSRRSWRCRSCCRPRCLALLALAIGSPVRRRAWTAWTGHGLRYSVALRRRSCTASVLLSAVRRVFAGEHDPLDPRPRSGVGLRTFSGRAAAR